MKPYPLVLFTGKGRSGKDTAAGIFCAELGGVSFALADPIKRFFLKAGLTAEQLWGSEKEVSIKTPDFDSNHAKFWLSSALNGWMTPVQLLCVGFGPWAEKLSKLPTTTPRHLMQSFGTECVRSGLPDLWADFGLFVAGEVLAGRRGYSRELGLIERTAQPPDVIAVTDGRFRNEILKVKRIGGYCVRLLRENVQAGFTDAAKAHASEKEQDTIPAWWFDKTVKNDEGLAEFEERIKTLTRELRVSHTLGFL